MPELPEVETVLSGLKQVMLGKTIVAAHVLSPQLRGPIPQRLGKFLSGKTVCAMLRRAKYMMWEFADCEESVVVHLGMSGVFRVIPADRIQKSWKNDLQKHDHFLFDLEDGTRVIYRDPRRFGVIDLVKNEQRNASKYFVHLGVEPLSENFCTTRLQEAFRKKKLPVKQAIMDQKIVVGVGNIYASEALYKAGISPLREACSLSADETERLIHAIKSILGQAIENGGSTLRDYRKIGGERGYFQTHFSVYDRTGKACPDCICDLSGTGGIKRIVQGQRSTFYCPVKQE